MSKKSNEIFRSKIEKAETFSKVWDIVKETVKYSLGEARIGLMLFLDNLPLQIGAYHALGTNNIILNRNLIEIVRSVAKSKKLVNALAYILLLHEYIHSLGHLKEEKVRNLVIKVSEECFGEKYIVVKLAKKSPWVLLKGLPLSRIKAPKRAIKIIKVFEKSTKEYIV